MNLLKKSLTASLTVAASAAVLCMTVFAESGAAASGTTAAEAPTMAQLIANLAPWIIGFVLLYLLLMRPQQKREKEAQVMRENVRVGDEVCTAGGIVGIVLKVNDDSVVLETGGERNKIRVKKWAIHENITQMEEAAAKEKERKAARQKNIAAAGVAQDPPKKKKDE